MVINWSGNIWNGYIVVLLYCCIAILLRFNLKFCKKAWSNENQYNNTTIRQYNSNSQLITSCKSIDFYLLRK